MTNPSDIPEPDELHDEHATTAELRRGVARLRAWQSREDHEPEGWD